MARGLGQLLVSLGLDASEFFSGLTKAEADAKRSLQNISRSFDQLKSIAATVGIGLGANAFKDMIQGAFDAQEELSNLGKRAGITGAELSSLSTAAKLSHTGLEDVANMSAKVSKALLEFEKTGSQSTAVLTALGVSAKDVPGLLAKPADAVLKLAKLLDQLPEGGTKAAAQLLIIGKAGGTTSAFLSELATQTELVKKRTDDEIEAAKAFNDRLVLMGIKTDDLKTKFANALLPTLDAVLTAFQKLTSGAGGAADTLERLKNDGDVQEWARNSAIAVGTLAESLVLTARLALAVGGSFRVVAADIDRKLAASNAPSQKPFGALGFTAEEAAKAEAEFIAAKERQRRVTEDADRAYANLVNADGAFITDAIKKSFAEQDAARNIPASRMNADRAVEAPIAAAKAAAARAKAVQDAINSANRGAIGDDPARRILEGQIKALEASIAREREILSARQDFLRDYYQDGRLSLTQYYDQLQGARDTNLQNTIASLNKEIALAEAAKAKALKAGKRTDAEGFQNTADAARDKQDALTLKARFDEEALARERDRATEQYGFQLNELNAKMLELAGNTAAAAAIRFDDQTAVFNRGLKASDNTGALKQQAAIKDSLVTQAALNDKNREFQLILNGVGIAQERISLAQQTAAISEIEALTKTSEAAAAQIPRLTAIANAMEAIANKAKDLNADGSINIVKLEQLQAVDQLRLGVERLAAQTDLLKDKFNNILGTSFSDAIQELANGTKSFKDAAKDLGKSILGSINKLAADDIAQKLFGKEGPLSGIGGMLSKLFGGKGAEATGAAALTTAGTTLSASGTLLNTAGTLHTTAAGALSAAAAALSAAAATMGGSSAAGALGGLGNLVNLNTSGLGYGTIGSSIPPGPYPYASGTNYAHGGLSLVGEHGPEILNLPRGAQVIPMADWRKAKGGGVTNVFNVNVLPGANTQSVMQTKAMLRDAVMQSARER